jgi:hypothetical protein
VVDHVPLGDDDHRAASPPENPPPPRKATLELLVTRITTIKLAYWAALTAVELALPFAYARDFSQRFGVSVVVAAAFSAAALYWANRSARAPDRRVGSLPRSIPTIATAFAAATVVASPASLPLLLIERQRSFEECLSRITCHPEALWLWVVVLFIGFIAIPLTFAASLRGTK